MELSNSFSAVMIATTIGFAISTIFLMAFSIVSKLMDNKKIDALENKLMTLIDKESYKKYQEMDITRLKEQTKMLNAQEKVMEKKTPLFYEHNNV